MLRQHSEQSYESRKISYPNWILPRSNIQLMDYLVMTLVVSRKLSVHWFTTVNYHNVIVIRRYIILLIWSSLLLHFDSTSVTRWQDLDLSKSRSHASSPFPSPLYKCHELSIPLAPAACKCNSPNDRILQLIFMTLQGHKLLKISILYSSLKTLPISSALVNHIPDNQHRIIKDICSLINVLRNKVSGNLNVK